MARIRTLKPEFPQSESMGRVSRDARLCFIELWTIADDEGRLRGASRMLASLLFPYDDDAPALMDSWLAELEREECVVRYQVDGSTYIQITKWLKHQKIDKPSKSKIPQFEESYRIVANVRECSSEDLRTKDQGPKDLGGANAQTKYRWLGKIIRLLAKDYDSWKVAYPHILDFDAELTAADCFYSERPPVDGKWFFLVSNWLKKANTEALEKSRVVAMPPRRAPRQAGETV